MKIDIKKIALLLVVLNTAMTIGDLPTSIIISVFAMILFSFFITHKTFRIIFKIFFLAGSLILIKYQFKTFLITEAGVSLVLILSALKLWELDTENDHFNMFLILALLECCLFLLNPTFVAFFFGVVKIIIFFYFILKIRNYDLSLLNGKRLLFLVAPSLLLSLLLFYTFPRFTQGFISTTNPQMLFSGADSQLSFKKLGPLNLSSKIVFRVYQLNSKAFPIPLLYWRESVLWDYYKEEWKTGYLNLKSEQPPTPKPVTLYKVLLSKDYNEFLPTLDGISHISKSNLDYNYYSEGSFRLKNISRTSVSYDVDTSYKQNPKVYISLMEKKGLRLKSAQKDKIKDLILKNQSNLSDEQKLNVAIDFFKARNFEYSLSPPNYLSVEDFILNGKSGYCSHFAASFAYMARAIGLPTRIVSGYQGGEYNPFDQSVIVREQDAHAWVEIYLKNSGWIKFDPTAVVAPGRIQLGAALFHDRVEPFINLYYYKLPKSIFKFKAINQISFWVDSLNSSFYSSILNFDKEKQQQILSAFLPKRISIKWLFVLSLSGSLPLLWIFFKWVSGKKININEKRYQKYLKRMRSYGLTKEPYETASAFCKRSSLAHPELKAFIEEETMLYINSFYRQ